MFKFSMDLYSLILLVELVLIGLRIVFNLLEPKSYIRIHCLINQEKKVVVKTLIRYSEIYIYTHDFFLVFNLLCTNNV